MTLVNQSKAFNPPINNATIGILGGSFDPIHNGHLIPAKQIATELMIKKVKLLPTFISPHKTHTFTTNEHREAMAKLACDTDELFEFDDRELRRNSTSYTVDTLRELKQEYPQHTLYFFMGFDSLLNFHLWHDYATILTLCHIVVSKRPNYQLTPNNKNTTQLLSNFQCSFAQHNPKKTAGDILLFNQVSINISSTELRNLIKSNANISAHIPANIADYIHQHRLYR
jgi:nicotinate-nucleotide adenylyltransferase